MDHQNTPVFHSGERAVQEKAGVLDEATAIGAVNIRDYMPAQHREFYEKIPFMVMASLDESGRPWATLLTGTPGFVRAPDTQTLLIDAQPVLSTELGIVSSPVVKAGMIGIELNTRRRNRVNGTLKKLADDKYQLDVEQSYGNCAQYIQKRTVQPLVYTPGKTTPLPLQRSTELGTEAKSLIANADTFFIASRSAETKGAHHNGVDVSHRGGKPGFVSVGSEGQLTFPDFSGNHFFNTLGNIQQDNRVGLVFVNFNSGDTVFITGTARVDWTPERIDAFRGAERIVDITPLEVVYAPGVLPMNASSPIQSPFLADTGSWHDAPVYRSSRIVKRVQESADVMSLYLKINDGTQPAPYQAGQFLPVRIQIPTHHKPLYRAYSLSFGTQRSQEEQLYRLTIKRVQAGVVSNALQDLPVDDIVIDVGRPSGYFTLQDSLRPIVMLSAGVGITPMISMLDELVVQVDNASKPVPVLFIHSTQSSKTLLFDDLLQQYQNDHPWLRVQYCFTRPLATDNTHPLYHKPGRATVEFVAQLTDILASDIYLCGPTGFITQFHAGFSELGVPDEQLNYELFSDDIVELNDSAKLQLDLPAHVSVTFNNSAVTTNWTPQSPTLLELAEANGLTPEYSCRSGRCGTCSTRIITGQVQYTRVPATNPEQGYALICCCVPLGDQPLILDA